jgi:pyruvate dehydrogenase E1 component alpha subunit
MSDPGVTYRDRDEVANMRSSRDCIEQVKQRLIDSGYATEAELKEVEKGIRASVSAEIEEARKGNLPPTNLLHEDIFTECPPKYIQFSDRTKSLKFN